MKFFSKDLFYKKIKILPDGYQPVEYIKATGTQYMDSGISCSGGIKCQFKANYQGFGYICGAHNNSYPYGRCGANALSNGRWELGYGETYPNGGIFDLNADYEVEYKTTYADAYLKVKGSRYDDWTTLITTNSQTVSTLNAMIFSQQYAINHGEAKTKAMLYYLRIYDSNDELKGDFIPCYRISDGVIGLYNIVNNDFITNSGTGVFEKGPDV